MQLPRVQVPRWLYGMFSRASPENPTTNPSEILDILTSGQQSATGINVSHDTALRVTANYACIRVLSETPASLPLIVYRRLPDDGKERAQDHPLYPILHDEFNPYMSSFTAIETLQSHVVGTGNCYAFIERANTGRVRALWPRNPKRIEPTISSSGVLTYRDEELGRTYEPHQILHVPGLGFDGIKGYNPIQLAREALGLSLATEKFGGKLFAGGTRPTGALVTDAQMGHDKAQENATRWTQAHGGLDNAHKIAVLEGGLKFQAIGINPEDAQFLETRKFQLREIARMYRMKPHMIADLDDATFSNIEHESLSFVRDTIRPWLVRWEREINRKLFLESERGEYFVEFLIDGLLRGDIAARFKAYQIGILSGFMSRNDARVAENWNKRDGLDEMLVPQNMAGADSGPLNEPNPSDE